MIVAHLNNLSAEGSGILHRRDSNTANFCNRLNEILCIIDQIRFAYGTTWNVIHQQPTLQSYYFTPAVFI